MGHRQSVEATSEAQLKLFVGTTISTEMRVTICVLAIMLAYSEGRTLSRFNRGVEEEREGRGDLVSDYRFKRNVEEEIEGAYLESNHLPNIYVEVETKGRYLEPDHLPKKFVVVETKGRYLVSDHLPKIYVDEKQQ